LGWLLAAAIAVATAYVTAAIVLGALPANASFVNAPEGIPVHVRTNGVHAELILPTRAAGTDWSLDHPPRHMRSLTEAGEWVAFGWGDRAFFASTPTWADLKPGTALVALSGIGRGAMHVEYIESPLSYRSHQVRLSSEQYARLVAYIRASFDRDAAGRPLRADLPGYFAGDAFYESTERYRFWFTCNDWVRKALGEAGVRTPLWSPFDTALFYQLQRTKR